jgi:Flp pilus assembly protein TadG
MPTASLLFRRLSGDKRATSALEFAFVAPVLFLVMLGIVQFGLTFNNYAMLVSGTQTAVRQLSLSRGSSNPYTSTRAAFYNNAPARATISVSVNGAQCTSDAACQGALCPTCQGQPAAVTASYQCDLRLYGYDFAPNCILSSTMTESVE